MANEKDTRKGVTAFGWVTNLTSFVREANEKLSEDEEPLRAFEINALVEKGMADGKIDFRSKFGKSTDEQNALYALLNTAKKAKNGLPLLAYYERHRVEKGWTGLFFATEEEINKVVKENTMFRIGEILFENWKDGIQFLEDLKMKCIPEKWSYQNHQAGIPHPIFIYREYF
jgi:hypothetical protein